MKTPQKSKNPVPLSTDAAKPRPENASAAQRIDVEPVRVLPIFPQGPDL